MKLSDLRPAPGSHTREKRVGRGHGTGRGKTSGRGTKGQMARTGGKVNRSFNGGQTRLSKRLPFVRGLGNSNTAFRDNYTVVNLEELDVFEVGEQVGPEALVAKGLMTKAEGKGLIKVLGSGELDRALTIHAHRFSASAQSKIEAAGGRIELIPTKVYEKTKRRKDDNTKTSVGSAEPEPEQEQDARA